MTFRASTQIKADGLSEAKRLAVDLKAFAQDHRMALAAGNVSANLVIQIMQTFRDFIVRLAVIASVPGMAAYAIDQENDVTYDVAAEFTAMRNAAIAVRDRIIAEMPKANSPAAVAGRAAVQTLNADGSVSTAVFTPAQTANLRTDLDTFIATIS